MLLAVAIAIPPVAVVANGAKVCAVDHGGPDVILTKDGRSYVASWRPLTVSVTVMGSGDDAETYLRVDHDDSSTMLLRCEPLGSAGANLADERCVGSGFATRLANATDGRTVTTVVRPDDGGGPIVQASRDVTVLTSVSDADGSSLGSRGELDRGTDVLVTDTNTSTNNVPDDEKVNRYETDSTNTDTDDGGLSDSIEINE